MLQVCDDARAGAVLNDISEIYSAPRQHHRQGTLFTLTVNTLAADEFLLTHAAKPDRGNGSLRFVYGAAGYLAMMTKLLPVILAVPVVAWPTPQGSLLRRRLRFHAAGYERHPGVARCLEGAAGDGPAGSRRATRT